MRQINIICAKIILFPKETENVAEFEKVEVPKKAEEEKAENQKVDQTHTKPDQVVQMEQDVPEVPDIPEMPEFPEMEDSAQTEDDSTEACLISIE